MANNNGLPMNRSSPHSSEEASHHGTPSTNFTAFSPENVGTLTGARPNFHIVLEKPNGNTTHIRDTSASSADPFTNERTPTSAHRQLSPTANVFTPGLLVNSGFAAASAASNGTMQTIISETPRNHGRGFGAIGEVTNLSNAMQAVNLSVPRHPSLTFHQATYVEGSFTTDEAVSRTFMIANIPLNTSPITIHSMFNPNIYKSITGINATKLPTEGIISLNFANILDAQIAYQSTQFQRPNWHCTPLSPHSYALQDNATRLIPRITSLVSNFEGQLMVSVYFDGRVATTMARQTFAMIRDTLNSFGQIKAFHTLPCSQGNVRDIRVEFNDVRNAENCARSLNNVQIDLFVFSVENFQPDIMRTGQPFVGPRMQPSITGRSNVPVDDRVSQGMHDFPSRHQNIPRSRFDTGGNHNQVDIRRIQLGLDVRTTIMLRNIPNKIDQGMLKQILDEVCKGCYDFMYLRIDFANNCNVGYAFINFVTAEDIIDFAVLVAGKKWNRFNSDKVAEISYATIQGKDCLVAKFRNSSVMLEHPTFRPKLFVTGTGPDAGDEEPFPGPDNPSKMRRSVENAEHVGLWIRPKKARRTHARAMMRSNYIHPASNLRSTTTTQLDTTTSFGLFAGIAPAPTIREITLKMYLTNTDQSSYTGLFAPRQGQVYREEQRRRRSQYDRGTPGAEYEAYAQGLSDPALSPFQPPPPPTFGAPGPSSWFSRSN